MVYFFEIVMGILIIIVSVVGVDTNTQQQTVNCPPGEKPCGSICIPNANCCLAADCAASGPNWVCNAGTCDPPPCSGFPNGCSSYVDATASGANRTITFSGSGYSPDCIRISSSQSVTFSGSFFSHPL